MSPLAPAGPGGPGRPGEPCGRQRKSKLISHVMPCNLVNKIWPENCLGKFCPSQPGPRDPARPGETCATEQKANLCLQFKYQCLVNFNFKFFVREKLS